ncbi:class I adenylate-forming enzyme family protein [Natronolimnohabitans innermongolicus]|uniref:O-succinylbenzoate--CoA ligase n=1 Tax=Natronolimnohabitans innermongolicus JCM 12255 TaxID=1227499 RepID=L9WN52_9EURY|nr:AMP-binding protein [Natronolimnohabitans innermongolicus]ELY50905.1 o-succinylbenzoate--CoA ligase [Natronolimnohabitans innermongolicus JCM 12255]
MNFVDTFTRTVRRHGSDTAIVSDDGRSMTYEDLDDRTTRLANAIDERVPEQRVATLAINGPAAIETMIASQKRGIGNVQLPFRDSPGGLVAMLEPTDASLLVFDDANAEKALEVLDRTEIDVGIHAGERSIEHDAVEPYDVVLSDASTDAVETHPDHEHGVFYTSGTTSTPKAVLFDQEQLWHGSTQVIMEMGIDETDTALVTTPWYHMVTCDAWILPHIQAGATLVVQSDFDPDEALQLVDEHDATGALAVPTQLHALADCQRENEYDIETLSYIRTGGSIVTEALVEKAAEHLTRGVYNTYGLTEGGPNLTFAHPWVQDEHTGSIGKESFVSEVRVVEAAEPDEDPDPNATVDPGESGEILVRGPGTCNGYMDRPEETDWLLVEDEWVRTGDVAEVDEDGFLYITGRVDNMIVSGGENIYPEEVEEAIETHDGVDEAVVLGLEDEEWGHRVACVVCTEDDGLCEDDLDQFCKDHDELADFKRPREYVVVIEGSLPRTDTGTIERETVHLEYFAE